MAEILLTAGKLDRAAQACQAELAALAVDGGHCCSEFADANHGWRGHHAAHRPTCACARPVALLLQIQHERRADAEGLEVARLWYGDWSRAPAPVEVLAARMEAAKGEAGRCVAEVRRRQLISITIIC